MVWTTGGEIRPFRRACISRESHARKQPQGHGLRREKHQAVDHSWSDSVVCMAPGLDLDRDVDKVITFFN